MDEVIGIGIFLIIWFAIGIYVWVKKDNKQ